MSDNKLLKTLKFQDFTLNSRRETLTAIDSTGAYLVKVQLVRNPRKEHDISGEWRVMNRLNEMGSRTCPKAHEFSSLDPQDLGPEVPSLLKEFQGPFDYIIQDYVPSVGNYSLADLLLTIIEQKKLGVYQGDIKPDNVRFDPKLGMCVLIDYDQSVLLTEEQRNLDNLAFLKFCDTHDKEKFGFGNWLRHFSGANSNHVLSFLKDGALDLSNTSVFRTQKTTNTINGIYHTINTRDVFIEGSRGLDRRAEILDSVKFQAGERILDVGCNAGLLCEYLHDRGCKVTGVDNDPHIVVAAKVLANILGRDIEYNSVDLDFVEDIGTYDTVMLFSVFHHTRNPQENARKIIRSCKRIIIETRLVENGKQPVDGRWVDTTRWSFQSLEDLSSYLEKTFVGFKFVRNLGFADKGRYILELVKE